MLLREPPVATWLWRAQGRHHSSLGSPFRSSIPVTHRLGYRTKVIRTQSVPWMSTFGFLAFATHPWLVALRISCMQRASVVLASLSTGAAGTIHFAVIDEHAAEARWLGVGFALVGLIQ